MGRRGGPYTKVTTVGNDVFGRKVVRTRFVKDGGCGVIVTLFIL
jgi:hypothetical protein